MASRKTPDRLSQETDKSPRVNYLRQFPRSFVGGYGQFKGKLTEQEVLKRLHSWNCEWLKRPRIAMSEMAQTLTTNLPILEEHEDRIVSERATGYLSSVLTPIQNALARFDNQDRSVTELLTEDDVRKVMNIFQANETFEHFIKDLFQVSGSMFLIANHCLALQTLLWNPEDFAEKLQESKEARHFKADPTQELTEFLYEQLVPQHTSTTREQNRRTVWTERRGPSVQQRRGQRGQRGKSNRRGKRPAQTRTRTAPPVARTKKPWWDNSREKDNDNDDNSSENNLSEIDENVTLQELAYSPLKRTVRGEEEEDDEEQEDYEDNWGPDSTQQSYMEEQETSEEEQDEEEEEEEIEISPPKARKTSFSKTKAVRQYSSEKETPSTSKKKTTASKKKSTASHAKEQVGRKSTSTTKTATKSAPVRRGGLTTRGRGQGRGRGRGRGKAVNQHVFFD